MKIQDFRAELRSQLTKICVAKKWNFDNAKQRGMAFEDWCYELLHDRYPAVDSTLEDCIIRGDDMEVDIWFESKETEEIYLIQAKHPKIAASDPIDESEVKTFFDTYKLLKDNAYLKLRPTRNPKVREIQGEFPYWLRNNFNIHMIFISTGSTSDKISALEDFYNRSENANNVKFEVWDNAKLRDEYVAVKLIEEHYPDQVLLTLAEGNFILMENELENITFVVRGSVLKELAHRHKDSLFNWNIRRFLGKKGAVNTGLTKTLENEPEHFFYYNNGISALCEKFSFDPKTRELRVEKMQIVNGAQTLGALRYANTIDAAKAMVLVKLTAVKHAVRETGLAAAMIRSNNTQNSLRVPDFRSNDPIQLWLEQNFKELKPKGDLSKIVYGRKRPYPRQSINQTVLKLQDFGKIRYAWLFDPRIPIAEPIKLFVLKEDGGLYSDAFGNDGQLTDVWTDDQFNEALLAIQSYFRIRVALEKVQEESELKQITRLRYYGLRLFKIYMDLEISRSKDVTRNDLMLFGEKFNRFFLKAMKLITVTLQQTYKDILNEQGTAFSLPRDPKVWELAQKKFSDNLALADAIRD